MAVRKYDNDWPRALAEVLPQRKRNKEVGRKTKEKRKQNEDENEQKRNEAEKEEKEKDENI